MIVYINKEYLAKYEGASLADAMDGNPVMRNFAPPEDYREYWTEFLSVNGITNRSVKNIWISNHFINYFASLPLEEQEKYDISLDTVDGWQEFVEIVKKYG